MFEKEGKNNRRDASQSDQTNHPDLKALLATLYEPVIREWWQQIKQGGHDLPLYSGSGEDVFWYTDLAGTDSPNAKLLVQDDTLEQCNFLYTRIWSTERADYTFMLEEKGPRLRAGGIWLAACMPLSEFQAYPYNYAFVRTMDLIGQLEEIGGSKIEASTPLSEQLQQAGFSILQAGYAHPAFIPRNFNRLAPLLLEWLRSRILNYKLANATELDALLPELQRFGQAQDTLVSRPGILKILALRSYPIPATRSAII